MSSRILRLLVHSVLAQIAAVFLMQVDRIIFCLFLPQDIDLYNKYVKTYFPLESTQADGEWHGVI